jgi:hypothetical protein
VPLDTDTLANLIGEKHRLMVELRALAAKQFELIEANDLTQLIKLLASKQKILTRLESIERGLDPFRNQDPEVRVWRTQMDRDRCAQAATQCEALRGDIVRVEQLCESRLSLRRDEAALRLQGMHQSSQVRQAYAQSTESYRRQLDLSSDG